KILSRNYRKRFGEIDIIAEKKGTVAFVEVKTRHENPLTRPFEAVDTKKQEKIYRTSLAYIYENDLDCQYRFDVCEVYVNRDTLKLIQINYFDNAFIPESDNGYY
nr:YraN family protein [Ruminococcus sp.]